MHSCRNLRPGERGWGAGAEVGGRVRASPVPWSALISPGITSLLWRQDFGRPISLPVFLSAASAVRHLPFINWPSGPNEFNPSERRDDLEPRFFLEATR